MLEQRIKQQRIVMLSPVNFLRNYSGFQYLADALHERGLSVEIFANIPRSMLPEISSLPYHVHSCYEGAFGLIPRLRHLRFRQKIRCALDNQCIAVIVNSTFSASYFREAVAFKEQYTDKRLILYCSELWLPNENSHVPHRDRVYCISHVNDADMIIDVEPHRAKLRKHYFELQKPINILPNTLPRKELPPPASPGTLAKVVGYTIPKDKYVLLFTGPVTDVTLAELMHVMKKVPDHVFLLWIGHASYNSVSNARSALQELLGADRLHICTSIPRITLLSVMHEASAGLILYSYRSYPTMNQMYAAPTKLYEYIAAGLPVVSYSNPSIKKLVDDYGLGSCAEEDVPESLGRAIEQLFARPDYALLCEHVKRVFENQLCYEECTREAMEEITRLIGQSQGFD